MERLAAARSASRPETGHRSPWGHESPLPTGPKMPACSTAAANGACVMALVDTHDTDELMATDRPRRRRIMAFPYLMLAPAFLLVAAVSFLPIGYAVVQSFFQSSNVNLGRFVGLQNYGDFFLTRNGLGTLANSLIFVAGTVAIAMPLGFALAVALSKPMPLRGLVRTLLILPWLVSNLVGALLWGWLGNPQYGLAPYLL